MNYFEILKTEKSKGEDFEIPLCWLKSSVQLMARSYDTPRLDYFDSLLTLRRVNMGCDPTLFIDIGQFFLIT